MHRDVQCLSAVRAGGLDPSVGVQGGADAEGIPSAIAVPPPAVSVDAVRGRNGRERVGHQDFTGCLIEHERMLGMQRLPASRGPCRAPAVFRSDPGCRRRVPAARKPRR